MIKLIFLLIVFYVNIYGQSIKDAVDKSIFNCYGKDVNYISDKIILEKKLKREIEIKSEQNFFSDEIYFYKIYSNNQIIGYSILDNVYGKSMPITFIVMFDINGIILCSEIIKYREQYGGAVKNENWLIQFKGKNCESDFKVGKDVNTISGATISVNSVTKGIKKLTFLIKELISK